ncbi:MAG: tRNA uridine-5-carboxymethylaminomethyl(34) synthesis GTPase MnmE [Lachnospiraceae bacterium]|nr:tRNA uridine-5-carboxymethylaminomethyl(34) synthesis GTPase MnmE [Lachnospiraceae bacterium]
MTKDTITGIATGMTKGGVSILRLSGSRALDIASSLFSEDLKKAEPNTIRYGFIKADGEILDEVLVSVFHAPKSYTGENVVEINCHGGILVTERILEELIKTGARLAEPGEFTKRAFLNGRIDLAEAESVMDLISAKSEFARKSSVKHLTGKLSDKIRSIKTALLEKTAYIEAALDDPEHFSLDSFSIELEDTVEKALIEIQELLSSFDTGRYFSDGIKTVILGKPNVGKSSLLNLLSQRDRAIVTDIPGTTRDTVEETVERDGILLRLVDTAGIRDTEDPVEKIGVERARREWEEAELLLLVLDSSAPFSGEDRYLYENTAEKKRLVLLNKKDLPKDPSFDGIRGLPFSAKTGEGLKEMMSEIKKLFFNGELSSEDDIVITNLRHKELLQKTKDALEKVLESIHLSMPEDFFTIDLMAANKSLGELLGEEVKEDLVNEIFSRFCMGK